MKRLRIIGLTLLALFALGAFAASMASAEEGVLEPLTSTGTGGNTKLLTTAKELILCEKISILEARFLTEKEKDQHGTADLHITGCKAEDLVPISTLGDEKEVILETFLFLVCLVEPTKLIFGLLLQPIATAHLEIPALKQLLLVKGAVIAELEKGQALKAKEFKWALAGKTGVQTTATKCVINGKEFKHSFEAGNDKEAKDIGASEEGKFTLAFPKEVELMDT